MNQPNLLSISPPRPAVFCGANIPLTWAYSSSSWRFPSLPVIQRNLLSKRSCLVAAALGDCGATFGTCSAIFGTRWANLADVGQDLHLQELAIVFSKVIDLGKVLAILRKGFLYCVFARIALARFLSRSPSARRPIFCSRAP